MRMSRRPAGIVSVLSLLLLTLPAVAQNPTSGSDRLFLAFAEDATVIDESQWWEVQVEFADGDIVDATIVRGIVAIRARPNLEIGGRVGFGNTDTPAPFPDGSGATDLDAWAKYYLGSSSSNTEFAVGGIVTIPTGDDTAGLGFDSFGLGAFGSVRHRLERAIITGHAGLRLNGDGMFLGSPGVDGKTSVHLGGGVIVPLSDQVTAVGELYYEGERFDGAESDVRILGGINWRVNQRGMVRFAVALGLEDGAPDAQLLGGYAFRF